MSLNFCEKNPDQGVTNVHCYHPAAIRGRVQIEHCCWCGQEVVGVVRSKHGPHAKGPGANARALLDEIRGALVRFAEMDPSPAVTLGEVKATLRSVRKVIDAVNWMRRTEGR